MGIVADGICLFRCFSAAITGDQSEHMALRIAVVSSMAEKQNAMDQDGTWGTDLEIQAASDLFNCRIHVYMYSDKIWQTFEPINAVVCINMYVLFKSEHFNLVLSV